MKLHAIATAVACTLLGVGTALAYHPTDRFLRGTLDPDQLELIERDHVQSEWLPGMAATAAARQVARPARRVQRATGPVPFATEHHTR
jgi:hypothetical protein